MYIHMYITQLRQLLKPLSMLLEFKFSTVTPFFEHRVSMYCHNLLLIEGLPFRRAPAVFQKDASHLLRLFRVFSDPAPVDRDVGLAVQECMSLMAPAYLGVGRDKALLLEAALLENIYSVRTMV